MSGYRITLGLLAGTAVLAALLVYPGSLLGPAPVSAATITVTTANDGALNGIDGQCNLREAIVNANADSATQPDCGTGAGDDLIVFQAGITLITLIGDLPQITDAAGLTIDGAGAVTISGATVYRPFFVSQTGVLTLQDLTITAGLGDIGGGVSNSGEMTLIETTVTANKAEFSGGGIRNSGILTVIDSVITDNQVIADGGSGGGIINFHGDVTISNTMVGPDNLAGTGGGLFNVMPTTGGRIPLGGGVPSETGTIVIVDGTEVVDNLARHFGGGIGNNAELTVVDSTVADNEAVERGGGIFNNGGGTAAIVNSAVGGNNAPLGGGIWNGPASTVQVKTGSDVNGNTATANGGGIFNAGTATLAVTDSAVDQNTAASYGGGINNSGEVTVTGGTVDDNTATAFGGGGFENQGMITLINTSVSGNSAGTAGAGIDNVEGATATITSSTIHNNRTMGGGGGMFDDAGGGILNDDSMLSLIDSTVSNNLALTGAGIRSNFGTADISNTTVSGNTASFGGGLYNGTDNTTTLINVTISNNSASIDGGGLYNTGEDPGDFVMINNIIADQLSGDDCDGGGSFVSQGNNLDSDNTCNLNAAGDIPAGDANLGSLANNGGPTQTHALLPGSDAIDAADDAVCAANPINGVDQRGVSRTQGEHCDIGSFELVQATPTPTPTPAPSATPTPAPTPTGGATPTPTPTPGPEAERIWADDDCNGAVAATDALKKLQDVAGIPYNVEPGCPTLGDTVGVQPAGFGQLTWGDTDCDGDYDAVDALQILRSIAGLPVNQSQPCPEVGASVIVTA